MGRTGLALAVSAVLALQACGGGPTDDRPGTAASFAIVSGSGQSGVVGHELADPIVVRATDASGRPVPNAVVNFVVTAGGGSVFAPAVTTNAQGIAQNRWTLGPTAGEQTVEVRAINVDGQPVTYGTFRATAVAPTPARIAIIQGDGQTRMVTLDLPTLGVRVTDADGSPIAGVAVTWTPAAGAGSVPNGSPTTTDASGQAFAVWRLGSKAGVVTLTASAGAASVTFTATATPGPATSVTKVSGDAQSGTAGQMLANPLVAQVSDQYGNGIAGVSVSWGATSGGGSVTPSSSVTDANGRASATWKLGGPGANTATASASPTGSVTFTATAAAAIGTTLTKVSGDNATFSVNSSALLTVKLTDAAGAPVSGGSITWQITSWTGSTTPSLSAQPTTTDASGLATVSFSSGFGPGAATVTASAPGVPPVTFTFTVIATAVEGVRVDPAFSGMAPAGTTVTLRLQYVDRFGNGVAGFAPRWTMFPGPNTWNLAPCGSIQSDPSDANGWSVTHWTLCGVPGQQGGYFLAANGVKPGVSIEATGAPNSLLLLHSQANAAPGNFNDWVAVTDAVGRVIRGTPVTFTITAGSASMRSIDPYTFASITSRTAVTVPTDQTGQAILQLQKDDPSQPLTIVVSAPGYTSITITH